MTPQLNLSKRQIVDLAHIRDFELSELDHAIHALKSIQPRPLLPSHLRKALVQAVPNQPFRIDALIRQMLALHGMSRQFRIGTDEVFLGLQVAIHSTGAWTEEQIQKWRLLEPKLRRLFET